MRHVTKKCVFCSLRESISSSVKNPPTTLLLLLLQTPNTHIYSFTPHFLGANFDSCQAVCVLRSGFLQVIFINQHNVTRLWLKVSENSILPSYLPSLTTLTNIAIHKVIKMHFLGRLTMWTHFPNVIILTNHK